MMDYLVLSTLKRDGKKIYRGSAVRLNGAEAEELKLLGVVKEIPAPAEAAPENSPANPDTPDAPQPEEPKAEAQAPVLGEATDQPDTGKQDLAQAAGEVQAAELAKPAENLSAVPTDPAERLAAIKAVIAKLDPADASLFTKGGKPTIEAIAAALGKGWVVTAAERDQAVAG